MPLSIMMTTASTMMAIVTTPILTSMLVGTLVPVDPAAMFVSVLQLVLAPVLVGATLNQLFPTAVQRFKLYTPFLATVVVVLIVGAYCVLRGGRGCGDEAAFFSSPAVHSSTAAVPAYLSTPVAVPVRTPTRTRVQAGVGYALGGGAATHTGQHNGGRV